MLPYRNIVLGVTGGIAAYKSAELVRRLQDHGAEVRVVMTRGAQAFVTPLTFQALSGNPVHTELLDPEAEAGMGHIELARWADLVLVAPASADFMARLAAGLADDLLATLCLASAAPIALAPAMNQQMWASPATQDNLQQLQGRNVRLLGPAEGDQACGDIGPGRMLEVADIIAALSVDGPWRGRRVLVTAGPTVEPLDPVRFIANRSSGRMGFALAEAARDAGAEVTLVAGPVSLPTPAGITRVDVSDAASMHRAVMEHIAGQDLFMACAAVADYTPADVAANKIKKADGPRSLELAPTKDILREVAALTKDRPFVLGFAAETEQLETHAREKLHKKNLDLIAANRVDQPGTGFDAADNAITLISSEQSLALPRAPKREIARQLVAAVEHYLQHQRLPDETTEPEQQEPS